LGAGDTRDRIVVTNSGNITLGGLLDLSLLAGFSPALGQSFSLFEGSIGSISGVFSAVHAPIFDGHTLNVVYGASQVMLQVGLAGDYNGNGVVDGADYLVWRKGLSTTYTQADYDVWRSHFGQTAGSGAALPSAESLSAAVPETSTAVLLLAAAIVGLMFRVRIF
jgi:hypothetical protein